MNNLEQCCLAVSKVVYNEPSSVLALLILPFFVQTIRKEKMCENPRSAERIALCYIKISLISIPRYSLRYEILYERYYLC